MELCNQHHYPLLEHFHHPKRPQILSFQLQPQATTNILPDSRDLPLLDVFYKCDHALDGLLPGLFHLVLGAHHTVAGIMSSFFYCWIVFHHVGNIFYSFTRWGILLLFPLFGHHKSCCCERLPTRLSVDIHFYLSWGDTHKWIFHGFWYLLWNWSPDVYRFVLPLDQNTIAPDPSHQIRCFRKS